MVEVEFYPQADTAKSSAVYATSAVSAVRENRNEDAPRQKTEAEEVIERLIDELGEVKKFMGALRERGERLGSRMWDRDFNDKVGIWQSSRLNSQYNYMRGAYEFLTDYSNTLCERITDLKDKRDNG